MASGTTQKGRRFGPLLGLLALSLCLNAWGLGWGLPSRHGWAPDEVLPGDVIEAKAKHFAGGWHTKYPPLQYYLLATLSPGTSATSPERDYQALFFRSRGLSLLMAAGVLVLIYMAGRLVASSRAALFATALVATMPPFVFYAKLANVDVPSLFWWTLSLVFLLRVVRDGQTRDFVLLGASAAAAIATKDQMYGLLVLCIPWILRSQVRRPRLGRDVLAAGATFVACLVLFYGLPWNWDGFRAHVALITGSASQDFREFAGTAGGQLSLLAQTVANLAFTLGLPAFVLAVVGVVASARRTAGFPTLALLIPALSYYVFFLMVVIYCYDRFVLAPAILLAIFGGAMLDWLWGATRATLAARTAVIAILAYGLGRCVSLELAIVNDARYAAEEWLAKNAAPPALVAPIGPLEYLPRMAGLEARPIGPSVDRLAKVQPRFVVTSADYAERADPGTGAHALYTGLEDGSLAYRRVFDHRYDAPYLLLRTEDLLDRPGALVRSNIGKVNPRIRIYERETAP